MNINLNLDKLKTNHLVKNILGIGFFKALGILSNFILISVVYRYFSNDELNGIWLTISSLLTWMTFFDFGIANSLRNIITKTLSEKKINLTNRYIFTTYIVMILPVIVIVIIGLFSITNINWIEFFNVKLITLSNEYLIYFIGLTIVLYSINFYLSILYAILHALYKSYLISLIQLIANITNIIIISILSVFNISDLIILGSVYIGSSIIISSLFSIYIFKFNNVGIQLNWKYFDIKLIKDLLNIGLKFLVLQLAIIVLFNTDTILISRYIEVSKVTPYQITNKLFSLTTIILGIILTPVWTQIIRYATEKKYKKIKILFKNILIVYITLLFILALLGFLSRDIISLWIGSDINITTDLIVFMLIFTAVHMWCNIFQAILNALSLFNIQLLSYGVATLINIPLSIYLVTNTGLGSSAIILGTIISLCIPGFFLPVYTLSKIRNVL